MNCSKKNAGAEPNLKKQIDVLHRVDSFMSTLSDISQLLEQVMRESLYITDAEAGSLALHNEAEDELFFEIALGDKGSELKRKKIKHGHGVIWDVFKKGTSRSIKDAYKNKEFTATVDKETGFSTKTILAVPIQRRGRILGVIEVLNKKGGGCFTDEDQVILEILASQAGIAIENARLYTNNLEQERLVFLGKGVFEAAHCIKNILNKVSMGASGIDLGIEKNNLEIVEKSWQYVRRGCEQISEMVLDMLAFSRQRSPEFSTADINSIIEHAVSEAVAKSVNDNIKINQHLDPSVTTQKMDCVAIKKCIENILLNAIDAIGGNPGIITIKTRLAAKSKQVEIQILDNGKCIKDPGKCFDLSFVSGTAMSTGFRLPVVKKIISEHGGTVESQITDNGWNQFVILLPN